MGVYQNDPSLPRLSIPELADTCAALKQMMRPLLVDAAYQKTCRCMDQFLSEQGAGPALQDRLHRWQEELGGNLSWLRPLWDDSYLAYRGRLPSMNYCFQLVTGRWGEDGLSALIWALARQIQLLREEKLAPEPSKAGPLSMDSLRHMLYTRIPGPEKDQLFPLPLAGPLTAAVTCKGHWFLLDLTDGEEVVSPNRIRAALDAIRDMAAGMEQAPGVGSFTAADRRQAADIRNELLKHPLNRISLSGIEGAAFAVCLDDAGRAEDCFLSTLLLGSPENRWFDKSLQIIAGQENQIGLNFEHAGCDATLWVYLLGLADACLLSHPVPADRAAEAAHFRLPRWNLSDSARQMLQKAAKEHLQHTSTLQLAAKTLTGIGKEQIKARNFRPDTFVQLLFQCAYYQLTGQFRSVYEPVSTRQFFQGRTDCARPLSPASAAFVQAFLNGAARAELKETLGAAAQSHSHQLKRAQQGLGPERHMWGMKAMHEMYCPSVDAGFFESEGYLALTHDHISTSSITAPFIQSFFFEPAVADGIGIGYGINSDALHLAVSAYYESHINPNDFIHITEDLAYTLLGLLE